MSKSFRTFVLFAGVIFFANLFLLNGYARVLIPYESEALLSWASGVQSGHLPGIIGHWMLSEYGVDTNFLRLSGLSFLLFCLFGFISLARPLFGRDTLLAFFLVIASSPVLLFLTKISIPDTWLAGIQLLSLVFLVRALKQDRPVWGIGYAVTMAVGALIQPSLMVIWGLALMVILFWMHRDRKKLVSWYALLGLIVPGALSFIVGGGSGWMFSFGQHNFGMFLIWSILGVVTWLGFLLGGFRDLVWKLRKKEEFAIILAAWLLGGLMVNGLILMLGFALLAAKQLQLYFVKNYPWKSWVRAGALIHLIAGFFAAFFLILNSYHNFGGAGMRAGIGVGGIYWVAAVWSVIGLYSQDRTWVVGGFVFTGLVPSLLALMFLLPKWELGRQWEKQIFENGKEQFKGELSSLTLQIDTSLVQHEEVLQLYAKLNKCKISHSPERGNLTFKEVVESTPNQDKANSFDLYDAEKNKIRKFYFTKNEH